MIEKVNAAAIGIKVGDLLEFSTDDRSGIVIAVGQSSSEGPVALVELDRPVGGNPYRIVSLAGFAAELLSVQ